MVNLVEDENLESSTPSMLELTLNVFTIVLQSHLMEAFFAGIVANRDSSISVVVDGRLINISTWHFHVS